MDRRDTTRRQFVAGGISAAAAGLLAGCGQSGASDGTTTGGSSDKNTSDGTTTGGSSDKNTTSGTPSGVETPYSVSIEPVGKVTFDSVPKTWVANNGSWADMGIALGLEPPKGVWLPSRYHTQYYDGIPGVSVDKSGMKKLWGQSGVGKEQFYALDADVHVMDPNFLKNRASWDQSDVEDIVNGVAPMFGNSIFSRGYPWHEDYRYYTLMKAFEKLAKVFKRTDRYEQFEAIHEDFQANLAPVVPARSKRPEVAVVWGSGNQPEKFYPYVIGAGTSFKHLNDLKVRDALANSSVKDFYSSRGAIDFETLLSVDPEVLLLRGQEAKSAEEFQNTVVSFLENHPTASKLTAVKNGDVYRAGGLYQGPITNLVLTERLAGDLYGVEKDLFDRKRVANVVNGEF